MFFNKKYEDGFRKFNRHLRQVLDIQYSEQDSKQASDRDRSNSQSQPRLFSGTSGFQFPASRVPEDSQKNKDVAKTSQDYEDELEDRCFGDKSRQWHPKLGEVTTKQTLLPHTTGHSPDRQQADIVNSDSDEEPPAQIPTNGEDHGDSEED